MNRIFCDLDGVVVDFDRYMREHRLTAEEVKRRPGAYLEMLPIAGALEGVRSLIGMRFEIWIATKPPTGVPYAYADKVQWVLRHLPELHRRVILTHHKGMLGDEGDYLIDDRPHRAACEEFRGTLLHYRPGVFAWPEVLHTFRAIRKVATP